MRSQRPSPETIKLARDRAAAAAREPSGDTIIARQLAQRLFAALKQRTGDEIACLLEHRALEIVEPSYDAADRLFRHRAIYVEPCRRMLPAQPVAYLAIWPDGTTRNLSEDELLALAGMERADPG